MVNQESRRQPCANCLGKPVATWLNASDGNWYCRKCWVAGITLSRSSSSSARFSSEKVLLQTKYVEASSSSITGGPKKAKAGSNADPWRWCRSIWMHVGTVEDMRSPLHFNLYTQHSHGAGQRASSAPSHTPSDPFRGNPFTGYKLATVRRNEGHAVAALLRRYPRDVSLGQRLVMNLYWQLTLNERKFMTKELYDDVSDQCIGPFFLGQQGITLSKNPRTKNSRGHPRKIFCWEDELRGGGSLTSSIAERSPTALTWMMGALHGNQLDCIRVMLSHAPSLSIMEHSAKDHAKGFQGYMTYYHATEYGSVLNTESCPRSLLHTAVELGNSRAVLMCLDSSGSCSRALAVPATHTELQPLHTAALSAHWDLVFSLLERGADPQVVFSHVASGSARCAECTPRTVFDCAIAYGRKDIAQQLMRDFDHNPLQASKKDFPDALVQAIIKGGELVRGFSGTLDLSHDLKDGFGLEATKVDQQESLALVKWLLGPDISFPPSRQFMTQFPPAYHGGGNFQLKNSSTDYWMFALNVGNLPVLMHLITETAKKNRRPVLHEAARQGCSRLLRAVTKHLIEGVAYSKREEVTKALGSELDSRGLTPLDHFFISQHQMLRRKKASRQEISPEQTADCLITLVSDCGADPNRFSPIHLDDEREDKTGDLSDDGTSSEDQGVSTKTSNSGGGEKPHLPSLRKNGSQNTVLIPPLAHLLVLRGASETSFTLKSDSSRILLQAGANPALMDGLILHPDPKKNSAFHLLGQCSSCYERTNNSQSKEKGGSSSSAKLKDGAARKSNNATVKVLPNKKGTSAKDERTQPTPSTRVWPDQRGQYYCRSCWMEYFKE